MSPQLPGRSSSRFPTIFASVVRLRHVEGVREDGYRNFKGWRSGENSSFLFHQNCVLFYLEREPLRLGMTLVTPGLTRSHGQVLHFPPKANLKQPCFLASYPKFKLYWAIRWC